MKIFVIEGEGQPALGAYHTEGAARDARAALYRGNEWYWITVMEIGVLIQEGHPTLED